MAIRKLGLVIAISRSPHGERGLKFENIAGDISKSLESLPTRGAWIEITFYNWCLGNRRGRSPHGERGLKFALLLGRRLSM